MQKIRKALTFLRKHFPDLYQPLAELHFLSDGETVFVMGGTGKRFSKP